MEDYPYQDYQPLTRSRDHIPNARHHNENFGPYMTEQAGYVQDSASLLEQINSIVPGTSESKVATLIRARRENNGTCRLTLDEIKKDTIDRLMNNKKYTAFDKLHVESLIDKFYDSICPSTGPRASAFSGVEAYGGRKPRDRIKYGEKIRKVHGSSTMRHIIVNKARVHLSEIRGRYRYV